MLYENFLVSAGNSTSIKDSTKINKNFENNQKINRSMMVESVTKLVNNVAQDVMQKNTAVAAAAAGASNTLMLSGVNCDEVEISGVKQGAKSNVDLLVKSQQSNTSKISTEISTSIDKTIEKVGATDLAALQAENTKQLNDFMKAMPGYDPNKAQNLASKCPKGGGSLISAGNSCDVDSSYELNASVKQSLELDESFKINDKDDISNDIKNKVDQANFASCQATASAANAIVLQDIQCGLMSAVNQAKKAASDAASGKPVKKKLTISDIQQDAVSKLYMTCIFDQKNVSEIANKITNSISKKYNQIYDAVKNKAKTGNKSNDWLKEKLDFVDTFAAAGVEKIMAAAGDLPPKKDTQTTSSKTTEVKSDKSGDSSGNILLPERKGFAPEPEKSGPNMLDDYRAKKAKIALDDAKKIKENAEIEAEKIKQKAAATGAATTADPKVAQTNKQSNQWLTYGGIILGLIIIFFAFKLFGSKNKTKTERKPKIEDDDEE